MNGTKRLTALVVDDEALARDKLCAMLEQCGDVEVVGTCSDGPASLERLRQGRPDLLFLDVQMPGMNGFQVLEALEPAAIPQVIFVTAHDRYALQAFEVHALDYLLKPFDAARLRHALEHARERLAREPRELEGGVRELLDHWRRRQRYESRIVVKDRGRAEFVRTEDIDWIEAAGNYLEIHAAGRTHLIRETLKELESRLDPECFVRIHRSRLVNGNRIARVESEGFGEFVLTLAGGGTLRSGRGYGDRIRRWLRSPICTGLTDRSAPR